MKLPILPILLIACTTLTASADWGPLPLKSMVEHSDCIAVAEFISEESRKTKDQHIDQVVTLKITSITKGEQLDQISVKGYQNPGLCAPQFIFPTTKGEKYLLFIQKSEKCYSILNGPFGALTITDNQVNWFTDPENPQTLAQRQPTDLTVAISAIQETIVAQAIEVLIKIEGYGFGPAKGKNERASDTAYQTLLASPKAKEAFTTLFQEANTAGKLYALTGLQKIDPESFQKLSKSIKPDETVSTQNGCLVGESTTGEIVNHIAAGNAQNGR